MDILNVNLMYIISTYPVFAGSELQGAGGDRQVEEDQDGEDAVVEQQQGPGAELAQGDVQPGGGQEHSGGGLQHLPQQDQGDVDTGQGAFLLTDPRNDLNTQLL